MVSHSEPTVQRRVQVAILLQLTNGRADRWTTATMVPGTDEGDFRVALENLLDEGSIEGPTDGPQSLEVLARMGLLRLTDTGVRRHDDDL